jgi:membrane protein implicated in regulation of membrane protease activity
VFCFVEVDVAPGALFWWIGAGVLVVLELLSGTFYLLMIALGCVAAAIAHLAGARADVQFAVAAVVALAAVLLLRRSRFGRRTRKEASRNPDVNLDIGQTLTVPAWHERRARGAKSRAARGGGHSPGGHERRARADYRGAAWDVELAAGEPEDAPLYEITELRGSCLVVVAARHSNTRATAA